MKYMKSRIREICQERGTTPFKLALRCGISYEALRRYEAKGIYKAQFGYMVRIAKALNCNLEDLYEKEGD